MKATFSNPNVKNLVGPGSPNFGGHAHFAFFLVMKEEIPVSYPAEGGCTIAYEGIASMWFDTVADFRTYQAEFEEAARRKGDFLNRSKSLDISPNALTIYQNPEARL